MEDISFNFEGFVNAIRENKPSNQRYQKEEYRKLKSGGSCNWVAIK